MRSRDPATGKDEAKTVTVTIERHAPVIVDVTLHDARTGKAETLTCTPEHPLYVQGQGWVEAGSVGIGTSIVSRAGPALQVTDLTWQKNKAEELVAGSAGSSFGGYTVYNLTVDSDHTFFVGSADGGTWVHNIEPCDLQSFSDAAGAPSKNGFTRAGRELQKHGQGQDRLGRFPEISGGNPRKFNDPAQDIVDDILTDPASTGPFPNRMGGTDFKGPASGGQGLRYDASGNLYSFLEFP